MEENKTILPQLKHGLKGADELSCFINVTRNQKQVKIGVHLPSEDSQPEYSLEIYVGEKPQPRGSNNEDGSSQKHTAVSDYISGGVQDIKNERGMTNQTTPAPVETEISNDYKGGNTIIDPVSAVKGKSRPDSSIIHNSYKGGNTVPAQVGLPSDRGYMPMPVPVLASSDKDRMVNALNYLLTSDKELHDESNSETKEVNIVE